MEGARENGRTEAVEGEHEGLATVRRLLLALVLFGGTGLLLELLLLEHYDEPWQWTPLVLLVAGLASGVALGARPGRGTVLAFRWTMVAWLIASAIGMGLHLRGNVLFEREMDDSVAGLALAWHALRGATPALAPGALAQLGILGLILVYRHPALESGRRGRG